MGVGGFFVWVHCGATHLPGAAIAQSSKALVRCLVPRNDIGVE